MFHNQIYFVGIHKFATSWIWFFLCARFSIVAVDVLVQILLHSIEVRKVYVLHPTAISSVAFLRDNKQWQQIFRALQQAFFLCLQELELIPLSWKVLVVPDQDF